MSSADSMPSPIRSTVTNRSMRSRPCPIADVAVSIRATRRHTSITGRRRSPFREVSEVSWKVFHNSFAYATSSTWTSSSSAGRREPPAVDRCLLQASCWPGGKGLTDRLGEVAAPRTWADRR